MNTALATTEAPARAPVMVLSGHIVVLRMLEVAFAIDLAKAEALWAAQAGGRSARSRLAATPAKAMSFGVPPLAVQLDPLALDLQGTPCEAQVTARLFEFGVVTLAVRVPVAAMPWGEFVGLVDAVDAAIGQRGTAGIAAPAPWAGLMQRLRRALGPAFERPIASPLEEDYLLAVVQQLDGRPTAAELMARVDLVPLLSGEHRPLSEGARAELLRQRFSYYVDDLVVMTWDRAFLYEPRGDSDVADVLEIANAQLLEMRYYDELLDDELPRMYDLVAGTRRGLNVFAARRYANLARRLYTLVAEVTELTEKVDNALQVTEDVYLARLYGAALEMFRVATVSAAVDRKLSIIRDTYTALYDEASSARAELMEVAILLLILSELVLALWRAF